MLMCSSEEIAGVHYQFLPAGLGKPAVESSQGRAEPGVQPEPPPPSSRRLRFVFWSSRVPFSFLLF